MKTRRFCPECGRMMSKSKIKGDSFQCRSCGEDFYRIEVLTKKQQRIIGRNSTYYDGHGNGPVIDTKYGRFYICPEKKLMRGLTFSEFYEGRNVD